MCYSKGGVEVREFVSALSNTGYLFVAAQDLSLFIDNENGHRLKPAEVYQGILFDVLADSRALKRGE